MENQLLTINMIMREALRLWQYDDSFAQTGANITSMSDWVRAREADPKARGVRL